MWRTACVVGRDQVQSSAGVLARRKSQNRTSKPAAKTARHTPVIDMFMFITGEASATRGAAALGFDASYAVGDWGVAALAETAFAAIRVALAGPCIEVTWSTGPVP